MKDVIELAKKEGKGLEVVVERKIEIELLGLPIIINEGGTVIIGKEYLDRGYEVVDRLVDKGQVKSIQIIEDQKIILKA